MPTKSETSKSKRSRGLLAGAVRDGQIVTPDWLSLQPLIAGVKVKEVKHVVTDNGHLTEIFRKDWALDEGTVDQVFQATLLPWGLSAWHMHLHTNDRLFINQGQVKIALYDAREGSPSHKMVNVFRFGALRPALVIIPPGVWHGVQNVGESVGSVLNLVDNAYQYTEPDHWRLPWDTDQIPYRFQVGPDL